MTTPNMPGGPIDVELNMNSAAYVQGANQAAQATDQLQGAVKGLHQQQTLLQRAMSQITPFRAITGSLGASAAAAAAQEQRLSQLAATQTVTGQSARALTGQMNDLARSFPIGQRGAEQLVQAMQRAAGGSDVTARKIGQLSRQFTQLQGATGEGAAGLGAAMTQLQRSYGNVNLDTGKIDKANDALTTLTAKTGTSAGSVLGFANSIAPLARQAGISSTAVLGISNAFSKMGDDGFTATNAISRVIQDLNRSVRDGGEEMNTYASIVGKTREEFEALYKANPTEALAQVTESLATPGPQGQRNLERIGLDGVRTSRILTNLSAQGGIRGAVETAMGAQPGATQRASEAAFGGLNDAVEQAGSAAEQLAIALGQPLLSGLESFTRALGNATGLAARATGARKELPGIIPDLSIQNALTGLAGAWALMRMGGAVNAGRVLMTSQIARSIPAGIADARGDVSRMDRNQYIRRGVEGGYIGYRTYLDENGQRQVQTDRNGDPMRSTVGRVSERLYRLGQGIGERLPEADPNQRGNALTRLARTAYFGSSLATEAYTRFATDQARMAPIADPTLRRTRMGFERGGVSETAVRMAGAGFDGAGAAAMRGNFAPFLSGLRTSGQAMTAWQQQMRQSQSATSRFAGSLTSLLTAPTRAATSLAASFVRLSGATLLNTTPGAGWAANARNMASSPLARGAGGLLRGLMNPTMLAIGGATMAYSRYQGMQQAREDAIERSNSMTLTEQADRYREALGLAAESTVTLASQVRGVARTIAQNVTTMSEARRVTQNDIDRARDTRSEQVNQYAGSNEQIAARISAMNVRGMDPMALNEVSVDLLREFGDPQRVQQIMDMVSTARDSAGVAARPEGQARNLLQGAFEADLAAGRGTGDYGLYNNDEMARRDNASVGNSISGNFGLAYRQTLGGFSAFRPGGRFNTPEVSKEAQGIIDTAVQSNAQLYEAQSQTYGSDYAMQGRYRDANELFAEALKTGNEDLIATLSNELSQAIGGAENRVAVNAGDMEKYDNFITAFAAKSGYSEEYNANINRGITLRDGGLTGQEQLSPIASIALQRGGRLGTFFDNRSDRANDSANREIRESVNNPADARQFREAVTTMVDSALEGGKSLDEVASQAYKLSQAFDQTTQEYRIVQAAREEATFRASALMPFQSTGEGLQGRITRAADTIRTAPRTTQGDADREAARREFASAVGEYGEMMKARLQSIREFGIQRTRMVQQYNLQVSYQEEDFNRQIERSDEDFYRQRGRTRRNFERQEARSIEDYNRQRARSVEDFNRQLARQVEDAAGSLLDPYQRLQTQPVWDTRSLVGNMREQLEAVNQQVENLNIARRRGLSTAVIDMLGLADPGNAQQLARIIADTQTDAGLIVDLNRQGQQRTQAVGDLTGDPRNNRELRRSREDFQRSAARNEQDFRRGLGRNREDFNRSMAESAEDYNRQMDRAQEDFQRQMDRQADAHNLQLQHMQDDLERSQQEFAATFAELQTATTDAMAGKNVQWGNLMVDGMVDTTTRMTEVINNYRTQFGDLFGDITTLPYPESPATAPRTPAQVAAAEAQRRRNFEAGTGGPDDVDYSSPIIGTMTSGFGPRRSPGGIGSTNHAGIDFAAPIGTAVKAAFDGIVRAAGRVGGYGNMMVLDHGGGRSTRYAHLNGFDAQIGQRVEAGEVIARSGNTGNSTGPHLHFETRQNERALDPKTTLGAWRGSPVNLGSVGTNIAPQDLPEDVLRAVQLLGLTPEQFIASLNGTSGGGTRPDLRRNVQLGQQMAAARGWKGSDWTSLYALWDKESSWNHTADNPTSSAYGIPQALIDMHTMPRGYFSRKTGEGARTQGFGGDPAVQIRWGLDYIASRYGDPDRAWGHHKARNWYGNGGIFSGATDLRDGRGVGERGPEAIIPLNQQGVGVLAEAMTQFIGDAEARMMSTATARTHITYVSETHEYDQRVVVQGPVTVQSQDPDSMGRAIEAKSRRDNLVGSPPRRS